MHATLSRRPAPDPVEALLESACHRRAVDRNLMPLALLAAVCLHLALLTLPLPAAPRVDPRPPSPPDATDLIYVPLPPPEIRPIETGPPAPARLLPVPFDDAPEIEPVDDPGPAPPPTGISGIDLPGIDLSLAGAVRPPAPVVYPEDTPGLVLPVPVPGRDRPDYPRVARIAGIPGRVLLRAVIDETGRVVSIEVVAASRPDLGFTDAAVEAVSGWLYEPGRIGERPVPVRMRVTIEFSLQ